VTQQSDETRCAVCGWPLGDEPAQCRRGDCSFRPRPERLFDAARAAAEARRSFTPSAPPAEVETHECRGKVRNWPAVACSMCGVTPAEPQPREEMAEVPSHLRLEDGTLWSTPDGDLEWRLRYGGEVSRADAMLAAGILASYHALLTHSWGVETSVKKLRMLRRAHAAWRAAKGEK
jgi:hypothetical protein